MTLSPREQDVLRLLAEGYSRKEAAYRLGISFNTVSKHCLHINEKLDAPGSMILVFRKLGWLQIPKEAA